MALILLSEEGLGPWEALGVLGTPQEDTRRPECYCEILTYKRTHRMYNFVLNPPTHINQQLQLPKIHERNYEKTL